MNFHEKPIGRCNHAVDPNPNNPAPPEVLKKIIGVRVAYLSFDGKDRTGVIEIHEDLEQDIVEFFDYAYNTVGFPFETVAPASAIPYRYQDRLLLDNNVTSGFNYRNANNSERLSTHALGRAFDVNPKINPQNTYSDGRLIDTQPATKRRHLHEHLIGGRLDKDHKLVQFMRDRDWIWGGDWSKDDGNIDLQHFEKPE